MATFFTTGSELTESEGVFAMKVQTCCKHAKNEEKNVCSRGTTVSVAEQSVDLVRTRLSEDLVVLDSYSVKPVPF